MKKKDSTAVNIENRRNQLIQILERFEAEGIHPTLYRLQQELKKIKIDVELSTINEDLKVISSKNTFVKDIAQYNYSRMCENSYVQLGWMYEEARQLYEKKWTLKKIIRKNTKKGIIIEEHITGENYKPKAAMLEFMIKTLKAQDAMRDGKTTNVSVALINNEFVTLKKELEAANKKLEE